MWNSFCFLYNSVNFMIKTDVLTYKKCNPCFLLLLLFFYSFDYVVFSARADLPAELATLSKQPTNYFYKILTANDTSTRGGFSIPCRASEKVFPPLVKYCHSVML